MGGEGERPEIEVMVVVVMIQIAMSSVTTCKVILMVRYPRLHNHSCIFMNITKLYLKHIHTQKIKFTTYDYINFHKSSDHTDHSVQSNRAVLNSGLSFTTSPYSVQRIYCCGRKQNVSANSNFLFPGRHKGSLRFWEFYLSSQF